MEFDLLVRCDCADTAQREIFIEFLDDATRPVLEEDVPSEQQPLFRALEDVAAPEWMERRQATGLCLKWFLNDEQEAFLILEDLLRAGAPILHAVLWAEDAVVGVLEARQGRVRQLRDYDEDELEEAAYADEDGAALFAFLDRMYESRINQP